MNIKIGQKTLITTDRWFIAPDGVQYRAVFGTMKGVLSTEQTLGIKTNKDSTNWYVEIGNMVIAGCQIHYAIATDEVNFDDVNNYTADAANGITHYEHPTQIYNAD